MDTSDRALFLACLELDLAAADKASDERLVPIPLGARYRNGCAYKAQTR
jgi:hypothetical protein